MFSIQGGGKDYAQVPILNLRETPINRILAYCYISFNDVWDIYAKENQANFICLAYSLSLLLEDNVEKEEGVSNSKDRKRRRERLRNSAENRGLKESDLPEMLRNLQIVTQRPVAFFRWIRDFLLIKNPWDEAIESLKVAYACR